MKNFDWEEFRTEYRVVHCDTEEKANDFLKQAHKHGMKWTDGQSLLEVNHYNKDKEDTCYGTQICMNTLMYHSTISSCYRDSNIIIDWEIDVINDVTNNDLTIGLMVEPVEYPGDYGIVMPYKGKKIIVLDCGEFVDVNDITVKRVWGEASNGAYALQCLRIDRELLYERVETE